MGGRTPPRAGQVSGFRQYLLGTPSPLLAMVASAMLAMQSAALMRSDFAPKPTAPRMRFKHTARQARPGRLLRKAFTGKKVTHDEDVPLIHLTPTGLQRRILTGRVRRGLAHVQGAVA